jgi:2-hydroxy-6-oxonona-2,4-dienedioate hydrolase
MGGTVSHGGWNPVDVTEELITIRQSIYAQPGFADSMRHLLCLQDPEIRRRNMLRAETLKAIKAPTLVLSTTGDASGPASSGEEMASLIPEGSFQLMDGAAHWPQWERPEAFNTTLLRFLGPDQ